MLRGAVHRPTTMLSMSTNTTLPSAANGALVLEQDPGRCKVLAAYDDGAMGPRLRLIMESFAPRLSGVFHAHQKWRCLDLEEPPASGSRRLSPSADASTLPCEPFEYITRQAQGDFTLQDQRDNNLFVDGGHGDDAGGLVARIRRRHGLPRMARAGATGASDRCL